MMNIHTLIKKLVAFCTLLFCSGAFLCAQEDRVIHRLGIEARPQYVFPTNSFLEGNNMWNRAIRKSFATHLKYSFLFAPHTLAGRIYGDAYQGIGIATSSFDDKEELGTPTSIYLFQGARIARLSSRLSVNYEWNFGISAGWKPYDEQLNGYNGAVGSKMNAYLNAGVYLNWAFSRHFDLIVGGEVSHYSNGNTKFPNAGVNTTGAKIGIVYNMNRKREDFFPSSSSLQVPLFQKHMSYDLVLFGSWRRKAVYVEDKQVASPSTYPVAGFNFAPMYNFNYKLRAGVSLDGAYDGAANVYMTEVISEEDGTLIREFVRPNANKQLSLGLSGRAEFVMPFFTIGMGIGTNVLGYGELKSTYQVFALKIEMTRSSFLHIGYNLRNFHTPNYLMLGLGYRFHNKYPKVRR